MKFRASWLYIGVAFLAGIVVAEVGCACRKSRKKDRRPPRQQSRKPCLGIPATIYHRPDPMIYDQYYLMKQGLAVTWDNPDIHVEQGGVPVPQHQLEPATEYQVVARIWNGSVDAPAVGLPVNFSYLDFGIGGKNRPIGTTTVTLPVKAAPGCPAFAVMDWITPSKPGHYCLQVRLLWADDANPDNNLGQSNTDVKALNSPRAVFAFPVRNPADREQEFVLRGDGYEIPALPPCSSGQNIEGPRLTAGEIAVKRREAEAAHGYASQRLPTGWRVSVSPSQLSLQPEESANVEVEIISPDGFTGQKAININAFAGSGPAATLAGGVTLYVIGKGE